MYSPIRTLDDLDAAQKAIFDYFRNNYKGESLTDKKLEQVNYLAIAAMYEYFYIVYENSSPFTTASSMCEWLYDFKGVKINPHNWERGWKGIYDDLLMTCNYIDKIALGPASIVIKKFDSGYTVVA